MPPASRRPLRLKWKWKIPRRRFRSHRAFAIGKMAGFTRLSGPMKSFRIAVLPGDGIGPEVMAERAVSFRPSRPNFP